MFLSTTLNINVSAGKCIYMDHIQDSSFAFYILDKLFCSVFTWCLPNLELANRLMGFGSYNGQPLPQDSVTRTKSERREIYWAPD